MSKPLDITLATFEPEVAQSSIPVVMDFWATGCGPCKNLAPILDNLAAEYAGRVKVVKVDVDAEQALAQAFQVRSIPTLAVVQGGEIQEVVAGFRGRAHLEQLFAGLVPS